MLYGWPVKVHNAGTTAAQQPPPGTGGMAGMHGIRRTLQYEVDYAGLRDSWKALAGTLVLAVLMLPLWLFCILMLLPSYCHSAEWIGANLEFIAASGLIPVVVAGSGLLSRGLARYARYHGYRYCRQVLDETDLLLCYMMEDTADDGTAARPGGLLVEIRLDAGAGRERMFIKRVLQLAEKFHPWCRKAGRRWPPPQVGRLRTGLLAVQTMAVACLIVLHNITDISNTLHVLWMILPVIVPYHYALTVGLRSGVRRALLEALTDGS